MSVFDWIAPVYGWAFGYQRRTYRRLIARLGGTGALAGCATVLDVGCGTGALCAAFADAGYGTAGVDVSHRMLAVARRKTAGLGIPLAHADATGRLPFPDASFDAVAAAFVSHGLGDEARARLFAEMARVARRRVLLYDYGRRRSPFLDLVETAEGGRYFAYLKTARAQMQAAFRDLHTLGEDEHFGWYWGEPGGPAPPP